MTRSRHHTLVTILIVIGSLIVGFFGWRTLHAFREFRGHHPPPPFAPDAAQIETDVELIRDWMTISYVSRTYNVPSKILFDALGVPSRGNKEKSLAQLNENYSPQTPGIIVEVVKATILANKPPIPPDTKIPPQP